MFPVIVCLLLCQQRPQYQQSAYVQLCLCVCGGGIYSEWDGRVCDTAFAEGPGFTQTTDGCVSALFFLCLTYNWWLLIIYVQLALDDFTSWFHSFWQKNYQIFLCFVVFEKLNILCFVFSALITWKLFWRSLIKQKVCLNIEKKALKYIKLYWCHCTQQFNFTLWILVLSYRIYSLHTFIFAAVHAWLKKYKHRLL